MKSYLFLLISFIFLGTACAPIQIINNEEQSAFVLTDFIESEDLLIIELDKPKNFNRSSGLLKTKPFPMEHNSQVQYWLNYYSKGKGVIIMKRNLEKINRYKKYMGDILSKEGLPRDLIYIAMVESGLKHHVTSHAGAGGYWQFIKSTGLSYRLQINSKFDERRDFALSTQAAAKYLKDLYAEFQNWSLSMASYNCGSNCVKKAIKKYNTNSFWTLSQRKALPKETRNYVPKVIAMAHISKNPKAYGFKNIQPDAPLDYELVKLEGSSNLTYIANRFEVSLSEIKYLNSKYKTDYIPAHSNNYIRVPSYVVKSL